MDNNISRGKRKSSLRGYEEFLECFDEIDFSSFINPYFKIEESYNNIAKKHRPKCYVITYRNVPDIMYIAFGTKDQCKGEATKYFRDNFHPAFVENGWRRLHTEARAIREPVLDNFYKEKKVPIPEVMHLGATFPCCICGKGNFDLDDYKKKRCFVVEGEGDINVFTKGYLLCYDCYKKYMQNINLATN